jgi:hypothetical protein
MRGSIRLWCAALAAALVAPGVARAQEEGGPRLPAEGAPALPDREPFEARIGPIVRGSAPAQLDRTWARVVDAVRRTMVELEAATPAVAGRPAWALPATTPAPTAPAITSEQAGARLTPSEGPTLLRIGRVRTFASPVVVELPSAATPRPEVAVLPGIALELPWMVP